MSTIAKENLDERIERMKKRNEELEKKYREAEEDRLMALKENAMVETKPPKDDDWPRTHKYDKIDFTYDVKREKLDDSNNHKVNDEKKFKRDYKKFPEGEGPPPDPAYNFLADAERDGLINHKGDRNVGKDKDLKQSNMNNKNKDQQQRRGGPNAGSFRGRGGKQPSPKYQKQNSLPEYDNWRNEREKIDEARISRQKIGEGKWRREWDNDKLNSENEAHSRQERASFGDIMNAAKKSPTHHHHQGGSGGGVVEKRGNITVSVSQTGEVKSVKLTSAPVIGTGRVGPRQVNKPQFSIQAIEKEAVVVKAPHSPKPQQKVTHRQNTNPNINHNHNNTKNITRRETPPTAIISNQGVVNSSALNAGKPARSHKPKSPKFNTTTDPLPATVASIPQIAPGQLSPLIADLSPESAMELIAIDLSHKPEFAKKSVQDRLLRIRQGSTVSDVAAVTKADEATTNVASTINDSSNETTNVIAPESIDETQVKEVVANATGDESAISEILEKPEQIEEAIIIIESNTTTNCDAGFTSVKSTTDGDDDDSNGNCDKNTVENIVQVTTTATEAVAAI